MLFQRHRTKKYAFLCGKWQNLVHHVANREAEDRPPLALVVECKIIGVRWCSDCPFTGWLLKQFWFTELHHS